MAKKATPKPKATRKPKVLDVVEPVKEIGPGASTDQTTTNPGDAV